VLVASVGLAAGVVAGTGSAVGASSTGSGPPAQCPARGPAGVATNPWPAAGQKLAPGGATTIRLCRYAGLNAKPRLKLMSAGLVTSPKQVATLIAEFDSLKQLPGTVSCPSDNGSQVLALIAYPHRHHVTISVGLSGCSLVRNGDITRTAANFAGHNPQGPRLAEQLKRLARGAAAAHEG
jgi:hypothetical protein